MIIASVADKWQYIHPKLATRKSSQFQAQRQWRWRGKRIEKSRAKTAWGLARDEVMKPLRSRPFGGWKGRGGGGHGWFGFGDNFFPKPPVIEIFPWHTKEYDLLQNYAPRKILFSRYEFSPRFFLAEGFSLEISLRLDHILEYQLLV